MSEEINDLIEDVSEVELQDEALEENVEVENEETIAEDADELEEGKKSRQGRRRRRRRRLR